MTEIKTPEYYWPPSGIYFSREQVVWVIREAWEVWPEKSSGYIDFNLDVDGGGYKTTPGQTEMDVKAEIMARLSTCPKNGREAIKEIQSLDFGHVDLWHWDRFKSFLSYDTRLIICYVSGFKRKLTPFRIWKCRSSRNVTSK